MPVTVKATDKGGNTASKTLDYTVGSPTPQTGMLLGANAGRAAQIESALGVKLQVKRLYAGGVTEAISMMQGEYAAGRVPWVSLSITSVTAADLTRLMNAVTKQTLITPVHEVNLGKMPAASFRTLAQSYYQAAANTTPLALVGPITTADPWRTGTAEQWMPTGLHFNGVDGYRFARPSGSPPDPKISGIGTPRTMGYILGEENADGSPNPGGAVAWAKAAGVPLAIGEFASHWFPMTNAANRPAYIHASIGYLRSVGCLAACWFHSPLGESGPWLIDQREVYTTDENDPARLTGAADPDSLAAFKAELTA